MGGRGSYSVSGGKILIGHNFSGGNDILSLGGNPDQRQDVRQMFQESGFSDVEGLSGTTTAVLGAYGIALNNLEQQYGAMSILGEFPVLGANTTDTIAAVRYGKDGKANGLILSRNLMGNISRLVAKQREMEASGYKMPTDGSLMTAARYTITHEYGHIMHNAISQRTGKSETQIFHEIKRLAETKYGASTDDVSRYGRTNSHEFFAEAFANANSGNPNPVGLAMREYLRKFRR